MNTSDLDDGSAIRLMPHKAMMIIVGWVLFFVIRAWLPLGNLAETYDAGAVRTGIAILTPSG